MIIIGLTFHLKVVWIKMNVFGNFGADTSLVWAEWAAQT